MVGLGLVKLLSKVTQVKRRNIPELTHNFGKSRKTQRRTTKRPNDGADSLMNVPAKSKGAYPTYEKAVNKTQPVTSPRKVHKVEQGRKALSNRPNTNESGNPATPRDTELVKAKGRAMMKMWGDNSIGRARSRLARGEQLLPHQSSAWSKHKNSSRGRGY